MATTYTATIEVRCWKQHTCVSCGCDFRYLFARTITGQGGTEAAARAAAEKSLITALENQVDQQPCPSCGYYQPDMIGVSRARGHWFVFWAALVLFALIIILTACNVLPISTGAWAMAVSSLVLFLAHLRIASGNLNRDLDANLRQAEQRVAAGTLRITAPADEGQALTEPPQTGLSTGHLVAFVLLLAATLFMASPELLRLAAGWKLNPAWYPQVAGPGDKPYTYFDNQITSVKGYWNGSGSAQVLNAQEVGAPAQLPIETNNATWGGSISVSSKESKTPTNTVWARVVFPDDAQLAGKDLKLQINMTVSYPALMGGNNFQDAKSQFSHRCEIQLSSPRAGTQYSQLWLWGNCGGAVLVLFLSFWLASLAKGLRNQAYPTSVRPVGEVDDESPPRQKPPEDGADDLDFKK
jgi:hypothetical protein